MSALPDLRWQPAPLDAPDRWLVEYDVDGVVFLSVARTTDGYFVRSHQVADFAVSRKGTVGHLAPGVSEAEGTIAFRQQVLPTTFQLSGACALHASAVTTPLGTVAFVGPSGAGKSTLAALLAGTDWRLLSDDYVPLERDGQLIYAHPTSSRVRLREATAERLNEPGAWHWGKWAVDRPGQADPSRLVAVFDISEPGPIEIRPLRGRDAVACLATNLLRLDPHDPDLLRAELDYVLSVVACIEVKKLLYPRDFSVVEPLRSRIWAELELTRARS